LKNPFTQCLLLVIKGYQVLVSPFLGSNCRFYPSCSEYTKEAISKKGILLGICMSAYRIARCNPFSSGGYDPVIKEEHKCNECGKDG
jgi:uncharacterized protein